MQTLGLSHLFKSSIPAEFAGVGSEARSKGGEPEVAGWSLQGLLQGDENARAADVAVMPEDFTGFGQLMVRKCCLKRLNDIAAAGVGDDFLGVTRAEPIELLHGFRCQ